MSPVAELNILLKLDPHPPLAATGACVINFAGMPSGNARVLEYWHDLESPNVSLRRQPEPISVAVLCLLGSQWSVVARRPVGAMAERLPQVWLQG